MKKILLILLFFPFLWCCSGNDEPGDLSGGGDVVAISSEEDLVSLRTSGKDYAGMTVRLTRSIALSGGWLPIEGFSGTFDGQGYTISGLTVVVLSSGKLSMQGLFGLNRGVIRNLHVIGNLNAGSVVGGICVHNEGVIEDCSFSGTLFADSIVGGICAKNESRILRCTNYASVTGRQDVGGIAGQSLGCEDSVTLVTDCRNNGVVRGDSFVGGILGFAHYVVLQGNTNLKEVRGITAVGGIAGFLDVGTSVFSCKNQAPVSGSIDHTHSGGISGAFCGDLMENCVNEGTVFGASKVAGITGENIKGTLNNCLNKGVVSAPPGSLYLGYFGGICGMNLRGVISDCRNEGRIEGSQSYFIGGIVGSLDERTSVVNCYNAGKVTDAKGIGVGGICGEAKANSLISACVNHAEITGCETGGIAGWNRGTVIASFNSQSVNGLDFAGGVVDMNEGILIACYNLGSVDGGVSGAGIVKRNRGTVVACYYRPGTAQAGVNGKNMPGSGEPFFSTVFASQREVDAMNVAIESYDVAGYKYAYVTESYPALVKVSNE